MPSKPHSYRSGSLLAALALALVAALPAEAAAQQDPGCKRAGSSDGGAQRRRVVRTRSGAEEGLLLAVGDSTGKRVLLDIGVTILRST